MTELLGDSLMVLLQRIDRRSYRVSADIVNGHSYRWVGSGVSATSLIARAKKEAIAHEDTQISDFALCSLDAGILEALDIEVFDVEPEQTTKCRICYRDLEARYYDHEDRTDRQLLTCVRCQSKNDGKMPRGNLRVIQ